MLCVKNLCKTITEKMTAAPNVVIIVAIRQCAIQLCISHIFCLQKDLFIDQHIFLIFHNQKTFSFRHYHSESPRKSCAALANYSPFRSMPIYLHVRFSPQKYIKISMISYNESRISIHIWKYTHETFVIIRNFLIKLGMTALLPWFSKHWW